MKALIIIFLVIQNKNSLIIDNKSLHSLIELAMPRLIREG
ncbi:hypothetical protein GXM_01658 [Nostoc sphaeroides CCNUC1]|uniref:Uncharacterized protein n=1 Tax=Nostoc sphaeroides CCNUC1 TaxID=2653204 RepID=A0A5P8VUX0_9NOSO|nr:hypothetical protein GXM_01658 [Nostoc sphaeroides CCNUC1]